MPITISADTLQTTVSICKNLTAYSTFQINSPGVLGHVKKTPISGDGRSYVPDEIINTVIVRENNMNMIDVLPPSSEILTYLKSINLTTSDGSSFRCTIFNNCGFTLEINAYNPDQLVAPVIINPLTAVEFMVYLDNLEFKFVKL